MSDGSGTRAADSLLGYRGYVRLWTATTVSELGTYVTQLAFSVLAVQTLHASALEVGWIRAAQWLPYLVLGVLTGALVDRVRRRPVLVAADLGRAVLLGLVPVLAVVGGLSVPALVVVVAAVGTLSLAYDAAYQAYVPRLVPAPLLSRANARLEQSSSAAQTVGPLVAGALISLTTAPFAVLVDAVSYLVSAFVVGAGQAQEPPPGPERRHLVTERRHLVTEMREGMRWVYRHPVLRPLALGAHGWFLVNSMAATVYVPYALRTLHLGTLGLGITLALAGTGGVLGGAATGPVERRLGVGPGILLGQWLTPVAYVLLPFAPSGAGGLVLAGAAQLVFGFSITVDSPLSLGYRQTVTPDRLQGRTNATIRSVNWGLIAVGAPVGGLLADTLGYRASFWVPIAGLVLVAAAMTASRVRRVRHYDDVP